MLLAHTDDLFYPLFLFGVYTGIGMEQRDLSMLAKEHILNCKHI